MRFDSLPHHLTNYAFVPLFAYQRCNPPTFSIQKPEDKVLDVVKYYCKIIPTTPLGSILLLAQDTQYPLVLHPYRRLLLDPFNRFFFFRKRKWLYAPLPLSIAVGEDICLRLTVYFVVVVSNYLQNLRLSLDRIR
jgi:hypothetical protein